MSLDTSLFMEPQVNQYGRNMVMTNVKRISKRKYVNFDSFQKDVIFNITNTSANMNITLPERVTNVHNIMVCNAEIPLSFYNISSDLGNNYFAMNISGTTSIYTIANGFYDLSHLIGAINTVIASTNIAFSIGPFSDITIITSTTANTANINFNIDKNGKMDNVNYKNKLGWALGFRSTTSYTILSHATLNSEKSASIIPRYLYLVVDEYSSSNTNSFISPVHGGFISKNILAKITLDYGKYSFGQILPANNFNGYLLTDVRSYNGMIDIQKLNVQLVSDKGVVLDLNGADFSFCLQIDYE